MPNFPIPQNMINKTRKYAKDWKRCRKCEYVTPSLLLRCPCCHQLFRTRNIKDKINKNKQNHIPIHLRSNVTILDKPKTFIVVKTKYT